MEQKTIDLFLKNYNNEGLCKGLDKCVKSFDKGYKKGSKEISYLPWAIAERIFRLQGGKIEVVDWKYAIDFENEYEEADMESGEMIAKTIKSQALFVHLKGTWMGEELDEYYPIFDSQTSKVIKTPNAQDLNNSRQRGSVRLIARLSGIGLWIFEQQDHQFEDGNEEIVIKAPTPVVEEKPKTKKTKQKEETLVMDFEEEKPKSKKTTKEKVKELKETEQDNQDFINTFFGEMDDEIEKPKETPKKTEDLFSLEVPKEEEYGEESEEKSDLLLEVKGYIKTHKDTILNYRNKVGKKVLSDLSYSELKELLSLIKN